MPVTGETLDEKETEKDETDDKVYCICKTEYEEGKAMIACDRFAILPTPRSYSVMLMVDGMQV